MVPDRVLVSDCCAFAYNAAKSIGVVADFIFKRKDGFTLAAPTELVDVAYNLYLEDWVEYAEFDEAKNLSWRSIREFAV